MAELYQLDRVERRAPKLPAHDLCLPVALQFGKLPAIHMSLGHSARQALANPLLLCDVVLPKHCCASLLLGLRVHLKPPCGSEARGRGPGRIGQPVPPTADWEGGEAAVRFSQAGQAALVRELLHRLGWHRENTPGAST